MPPVDRHPWTFRGQPESGGRLTRRPPASPSHPTHRGRLYVVGYGWLWLSGWEQADGSVRLAADPMTEAHVDQYCAASGSGRGSAQAPPITHQAQLGELIDPSARRQLAARAPAPAIDRARAPARTPRGGPSGTQPESHFSHTPPLSQAGELEIGSGRGEGEPKVVRRVQVARGGRGRLSSRPDEETTREAMKELNDEIPF